MSTMPGWSWTTLDDEGNLRRDRASGKTEDGMFSAELFCALGECVVGLLYRTGEAAPVLTLSVAGGTAHPIQYAMAHAAERMRGSMPASSRADDSSTRTGWQNSGTHAVLDDGILLDVRMSMPPGADGKPLWWSWSVWQAPHGLRCWGEADTEHEAQTAALDAARRLA